MGTRQLLIVAFVVMCWASAPEAQVARHHYLTPIDGSGTDADPYRSRCQSENLTGRGNIDLRDWGINRFLCASDTLPSDMTGVIQLGGATKERMTALRKAALVALVGRVISADTVDEVITELLLSKIRAGHDGKLKIWLGESAPLYQQTAWVPFHDHGYVADAWNALQAAAAWATTLATETFNCADNASLTCVHTWTEITGTAWAIVSNQANASGSITAAIARLDTSLNTIDHTASFTVVSATTGGAGASTTCSILARKENDSAQTFYRMVAVVRNSGELNETQLAKTVAGTTTVLDSNTTDWANNDVLYVAPFGSTISSGVNGTERSSVTDVSITAGTYTGIRYFSDSASGACTVDSVNASDNANTGPLRRRIS